MNKLRRDQLSEIVGKLEVLKDELVSKSGIHYFVVDGRCFPEYLKELKNKSNDTHIYNR